MSPRKISADQPQAALFKTLGQDMGEQRTHCSACIFLYFFTSALSLDCFVLGFLPNRWNSVVKSYNISSSVANFERINCTKRRRCSESFSIRSWKVWSVVLELCELFINDDGFLSPSRDRAFWGEGTVVSFNSANAGQFLFSVSAVDGIGRRTKLIS